MTDSTEHHPMNPIGLIRSRKQTKFANGTDGDQVPPQTPRRASTSVPDGGIIRRITTHLSSIARPSRPIGDAPNFLGSLKSTMKETWLNVLLVFIPVSWALHFAFSKNGDPSNQQDTIIFVVSFLAIIPLAKLLSFATEELAIRVGQTIGGLLNATLGNAVELIVAIIALTKCNLKVVQSSLVGSILSNLLLVLGMCFFAGGTRFSEQGFLASAAQLNSSLLTLSVIAVLLPAAFHFAVAPSVTDNGSTGAATNTTGNADNNEGQDILSMSRGVAVILLFIYGGYLVFQLWSHAHLYSQSSEDFKSQKYPERKRKHSKESDVAQATAPSTSTSPVDAHDDEVTAAEHASAPNGDAAAVDTEKAAVEEEEEKPKLSLVFALVLLAVVTVLVAVTADWLVDSISGLTASGTISQEWVGLILLPIVGNAAEHVTAVTVSVKDKLTLSLGVAVGSSIQIALFVIPFLVVIAWIMGKPLTMLFDPFESVVLFLAVLTVNYAVADGKSNWLEGMILMSLYVIIAVSFWFYPGVDLTTQLFPGGPCTPPKT